MRFCEAMVAYALSDATVAGLIGNRFYPEDGAPQDSIYPCATYQRARYEAECSADGTVEYVKESYQLNVYAETKINAEDVSDALINALANKGYGVWSGYAVFSTVLRDVGDVVLKFDDGSEFGLAVVSIDITFNHEGGSL